MGDSILSEAGGIWNAPAVNVKDSICYFSAAIQLMFRSFCHFVKKKNFFIPYIYGGRGR